MHNIIFIEGVSGVGKTTTTKHLCDRLQNLGCKARCYLEGDCDNPFDPFKGMYPPVMSILSFCKTYAQCWQNFKENQLEKDMVTILDGTLFHHQINDLIREYNANDDVITNHLTNILYIVQQLNPVVFYLSSGDVGQCLRQARKSRNQSLPTEENIAFWENRKRIDLYVLDKLSVESHILNIDDDWNAIIETMMKYII